MKSRMQIAHPGLPPFELPSCARCGHEVEELVVSHDQLGFTVSFAARCHGELEVSTVDACDVVGCAELRLGPAFAEAAA